MVPRLWPYRGRHFFTSYRLGVHVHPLQYTFSWSFERLVTTFWTSWSYHMNKGTLMDFMDPKMGPEMNPVRLIFADLFEELLHIS